MHAASVFAEFLHKVGLKLKMESFNSGTSKKSWTKDEFTELLLSWTLQDIFNDNIYKFQVEKIPLSFESVDHYLGSYVYPLLEETRAELASSLESAHTAPFAQVESFKESKNEKLLYHVKVDHWRNRTSERGKEAYRTLPGDFLLLSDYKPESPEDLGRDGWSYTFASVIYTSEDESGDNSIFSHFKLKTAGKIEVKDQESMSLYVVHLMNMTTHNRIWKALRMRRNLNIIEKVLTKNYLGGEDCEYCPLNVNHEIEEKYGATPLSKLNESQLACVMASTRKAGCSHKASVELVWGPPGTGKTTMLSTLLYILLQKNVRTLVCAPTNIAITELASRVISLVRDSVKTEREKSLLSCPLGDILIFGNKERLNVSSDIEEIFLDYRAERLLDCMLPLTGWRQCAASMLGLLEDCVSQHRIFVGNERIRAKECPTDDVQLSGSSKSFLEFVRDQFRNNASNLRKCMLTFTSHLSRSCINDQNYQNIMELMSLLDSIEMSLFEDSTMTSDRLEAIFLRKASMIGSDDTSSLMYMRSQCVSLLRSLQASLNKLSLQIAISKDAITDFCLQKALLIFCTVSTSYKLHMVDKEPFQLLVIDEAAQVKECETTIALQIRDVKHAVLVGDEQQLPAMISSKVSKKAGYGRSLFERLSSLGHSKHLLNVQYRMHPKISWFPNLSFYQNQILDAPNVQSESYERCYLPGKMFGPYSFINIHCGREVDEGRSRRNLVEVSVALKLVQKLFKAWSVSKETKLSIGLISPYAAQVAAIRDKIQLKYDNLDRFTVKVNSVDGFQGGEEDVVIISTVRTHKAGSIGFLASTQRANVALTRARHCLWILGNERSLSRSNSVWEEIISDAKDRQCFFDADEDHDIQKTIIDAKIESLQLENLLSGDSVLFKNSRWQVLFSDNFSSSFQRLQFSSIKKLVMNLVLKLASGWRPKKINVDQKCKSSSYILKQFRVSTYCIVCSVDITKDSSIYMQVLKVWDVLPMNETEKLFKRLDNISSMYTDDFINLCNEKLFEGNLEIPKSWTFSSDIIRVKNKIDTKSSTSASANSVVCRRYVENSKVSESLYLMKFYAMSSGTVNYLLTDHEGRELDLPFEVTDEEREIILFPQSSFILGRSGTGKSTILVMKLFKKLQQYSIAARESSAVDNSVEIISNNVESREANLRQLFVTVSPKLCHAVKKHVSGLKSFATENFSGCNISDMDDADEFKDIPDTFIGIQNEKYPLIITFHKFLMMLDGSLGNSYFQRFHEVRGTSHYEGIRSIALQTFMRKNEVTYDRFQSSYWPHFNTKLIKNLDASRVFTEIMSHIKGGTQVGDACGCKRSRNEYVSLSESRVSTLTADERGVVYDIFEDYEKKKLQRGEFDLADFVNDIHLRLANEFLKGDKMDFVYIDEVQDLTMRQLSLFRHICKNVDEGFVFSGDTAQTIARGIDFRFEDIRSLFYNEFLMRSTNHDISGRKEKGLMSDMFNLSQNFRTHTGVLNLAQSVIDLICYYFPLSIDLLAPETSLIDGECPVVLEPGSDENLIISIFGNSGNGSAKWSGFGADQVILVRDDTVKKEIASYIGDQATVLTIIECKGLEFQDVLLYNFFGSSPLSNQWKVVYEFLKDKDLLDCDSQKNFPSFSLSRHNILCSELKQLYVAITRTKQRLWICENNVEFSKPMLDYWKKLCLVQVKKVDDSFAKAMHRASTPEEWKTQGIKLFWEENYKMATMCFAKAGENSWAKRAEASGLRAASERLRSAHSKEADRMLREAAEIFDSINRVESAAECFCDLGDYERAGRIYLEKCGMSELRKAGECFCLARNYRTAAEAYAKGKFFRECLSCCTKGCYFDLGLRYIEYWKECALRNSEMFVLFKEIDKISHEFLENCAMECYKAKDRASMMKFVRCFHSHESKRRFLKALDCLEELLDLEEELGNFNEAAEIAKRLGEVLREIDLLEKAEQFSDACLLILSYVLSNSLWTSGNLGWPMKAFPDKVELLNRAMADALKVSVDFHAIVCSEVDILLHEEMEFSELKIKYSASKQVKTPTGESLCLRMILDAHFKVSPAKYELDNEFHIDSSSFDERISKNQVSCGTLVYFWNLWKEQSFKIVACLGGLEKLDCIAYEGVICFCLDYFGVRLMDNCSATLYLLNPDAAWVRNAESFVKVNGNVMTLEARFFVSAARKYWHQELVSVGLGVLEALQGLYRSSMSKPKYFQSLLLLHIFDIAMFFLDSKSISMKGFEIRMIQDCVQISTQEYFRLLFPFDPRESLSENMISVRDTQLSWNLLEEIVSRNVNSRGEFTYNQIGRSVMIMLGTGKLNHGLYDSFGKKLSKKPWKVLVESLTRAAESEYEHRVFSREIHAALEASYKLHWRAVDSISPDCFLYLLERLMIVSPLPGSFFVPKSSFTEHLMCLSSDANPGAILVTCKNWNHGSIVDFVVEVVKQHLHDNFRTVGWIERSEIDIDQYLPVLVLRLVMILCMSCLNWDLPLDIIFSVLAQSHIKSVLPVEFSRALHSSRHDTLFLAAVVRAFKVIGDPLVIVSAGDNNFKRWHPDAISLVLTSFSSVNEIIQTLFPRNTRGSSTLHDQPFDIETILELPSEVDPKSSSETENKMNWGLIRDQSDELMSLRNQTDGGSKESCLDEEGGSGLVLLTGQQRSQSDEGMIDDLSTLSSC